MNTALSVLHFISVISAWIAVVVGLRLRGFLWYYVLVSGLCDVFSFLNLSPTYPHWYGNSFYAAQFVLVCGYFIRELAPPARQRGYAVLAASITLLFLLFTVQNNFWRVHYQAGAMLSGLLILPTLGGFYSLMRREEVLRLERSPLFLFCAAFLLYIAGSFLIMVFTPRFVAENYDFLKRIWLSIHNSLNILKNLAITRALYLYSLSPKSDVCS